MRWLGRVVWPVFIKRHVTSSSRRLEFNLIQIFFMVSDKKFFNFVKLTPSFSCGPFGIVVDLDPLSEKFLWFFILFLCVNFTLIFYPSNRRAVMFFVQVAELLSLEDVDLTPDQIKDIIVLLEKENKLRKAEDEEQSQKITERAD